MSFKGVAEVITVKKQILEPQSWVITGENMFLVGGLEHFLFSHILGIIIQIDFHIFQRGRSTTNQVSLSSSQSEAIIARYTPGDTSWDVSSSRPGVQVQRLAIGEMGSSHKSGVMHGIVVDQHGETTI